MIHPIGNQLASSSLGLAAPVSERLPAQPEPAVQVTPVDDARSGRFNKQADARELGLKQPIEQPKSSLEKALESVNDSLKAWSTGMRFEMDEDAQRLVVSIIDSSTGEVLRTIPSEAVLRVAKMIVQLQGAGVDTQA
ncbi:flagellar protein FlaG [Castellaniella defragrans]|jgi:flagellar protein FlaG|nr:flagellar protein FlaG [Castellaniella defragrans]